MKNYVRSLCLALLLLAFAPASDAGVSVNVSELSSESSRQDLMNLGVSRVFLTGIEDLALDSQIAITAELFSGNGESIASASILAEDPGHKILLTTAAATTFAYRFDEQTGQILVAVDDMAGAMTFDRRSWTWTSDSAAEELVSNHRAEFEAAAAVLVAIESLRGQPSAIDIGSDETCHTASGTPQDVQNCEWFWRERGFGISASRSQCCQYATLDVNQKCSNRACWGCCQLWSCDAACGIGDYGCFCGRTGIQCRYEDPGTGGF